MLSASLGRGEQNCHIGPYRNDRTHVCSIQRRGDFFLLFLNLCVDFGIGACRIKTKGNKVLCNREIWNKIVLTFYYIYDQSVTSISRLKLYIDPLTRE